MKAANPVPSDFDLGRSAAARGSIPPVWPIAPRSDLAIGARPRRKSAEPRRSDPPARKAEIIYAAGVTPLAPETR